jgi:hypothetical protein
MDHAHPKPQGAFSALLADKDLAHLELVLRLSLACDSGGPLQLPPSYWRERLAVITRASHLSHTQIQAVHRLYLQVEAFEAISRERENERLRAAEAETEAQAGPLPVTATGRARKPSQRGA